MQSHTALQGRSWDSNPDPSVPKPVVLNTQVFRTCFCRTMECYMHSGRRMVVQCLRSHVLDTEDVVIIRWLSNGKMWGEQKGIFITIGKSVL